MMKAEEFRLLFFSVVIYVVGGVALFPYWYQSNINQGGVRRIFLLARTDYLVLNVIVMAVIVVFWQAYRVALVRYSDLAREATFFLRSSRCFAVLWLIALIASFRLLESGSINAYELAFNSVQWPTNASGSEPERKSDIVLEPPLDVVFIDNPKVRAAFSQIAPELALSEKAVRTQSSSELQAGTESGPLKVSGSLGKEGEVTDRFTVPPSSESRELLELIRFLSQKSILKNVSRIEVQSDELKFFDVAVTFFRELSISFSEEEAAAVRRKLIERNVLERIPDEFREGAWVLISGHHNVSFGKDTALFLFEYAPGSHKGVVFGCSVPLSRLPQDEVDLLRLEQEWNLKLFGKIVHREDNRDEMLYRVACYGIFR